MIQGDEVDELEAASMATDFQFESTSEEEEEQQQRSCGKGHRRSLVLETSEGGMICLACFSSLLSDPSSPTHHVSYALSQLSLSLPSSPLFSQTHAHILVSPLLRALFSHNLIDHDEALARQLLNLISDLSLGDPSRSLSAHFISRIADHLSSPIAVGIRWSRRHIYSLHCLGFLLNSHLAGDRMSHIRDIDSLFTSLVAGLRMPSEEMRGEILFVLYKLSDLQATPWDHAECDDDDNANFSSSALKILLLRFSLEALLKTQHDDVRMNCLALLTVLAKRGFFQNLLANDQSGWSLGEANNLMQIDETELQTPLINLFADAVKGPLLSLDSQVQIRTLDLIFHSLSSNTIYCEQFQVFVEENIADYVFEILRLSGNKDPVIISCLQVLILLASAREAFIQRLAIGFQTLLSVLHYVAEVPLHPVQSQVLKLVLRCILECPGAVSMSQAEEIALTLTKIFRRDTTGETCLHSETLVVACSTFVEILKLPSATHIQKLVVMIQEATRNLILFSLSLPRDSPNQLLLCSIYLLKAAFMYSVDNANYENQALENNIIETCQIYLLPWFERAIDEGEEEEIILELIDTFHNILLRGFKVEGNKFAKVLISSSWFSLSFRCLGLFPSDEMKFKVYLMLSSLLDRLVSTEFGQPIRDAYVHLPSDPLELLFLLGQGSSFDPNLTCCQRAILLLLYFGSFYGESLADDNRVLASLEQYILVNRANFSCGIADSIMLTQLVLLYGLFRGTSICQRAPYSSKAERVLFNLLAEQEWDILGMGSHPTSLKWIFQQEDLMDPLLNQLLNFCRLYSSGKNQIHVYSAEIHSMDIQTVAELVVSGDNCMSSLLTSLLNKVHQDCSEDDLLYVMDVMEKILYIYPEASNQFCLHGISVVLNNVYSTLHSPSEILRNCSLLAFNVLYSADHKAIAEDKEWFKVTVKLLEFLNTKLAAHSCDEEGCLLIGIFCLILHHSTIHVLKEASAAILQNKSIICALDGIVHKVCAKGPSLVDQEEETSMGRCLIFVLLLYFFSLRSLHANFQEIINWQDFLQLPDEVQQLSVVCIKCHDLCRLIYFGTSLVKLVASQCLLEVLTRVSDQRNKKQDELRCSLNFLESIMAVTEGLIFYGDSTVARNCSICLSLMMRWEKLGLVERRAINNSRWFRLILEELTMSLAVPSVASKYLTYQHKPAAHIAATLLSMENKPGWIKSVFDASCISAIIENLSASNVNTEVVILFRELMAIKYLNNEQVARLHHLFQVCRKNMYEETLKVPFPKKSRENIILASDDIGKVSGLLLHLVSYPDYNAIEGDNHRLLEEIDMFLQESSTL